MNSTQTDEKVIEETKNLAEFPVAPDVVEEKETLSKTQLKKQIRHQKWLEARGERRKQERERIKAKRREAAELIAKLGDDAPKIPKKIYTPMSKSNNKFRVVIDLDFNGLMSPAEISKATQQVARIYAANRQAENPCQLYISSLNGPIKDRFAITNSGYLNWDIHHSDRDYLQIFDCDISGEKAKKKFVYLTGDSDESLPNLDDIIKDESKIFVIGGLVDHNRHKGLCHMRAVERGISTAKLPIKEHVNLNQREILSTVTVFEILLQVLSYHKEWPEALRLCIPKRKIASIVEKQNDPSEQDDNDTQDVSAK